MQELLLTLMRRLETIGQLHEELYDTECREAMAEAIFCSFLLPEPEYVLPHDYGLCVSEANQAVREALMAYVSAAKTLAIAVGVATFQQRLAALQDVAVITESGGTHDDFFGYYVPSLYTEDGDWLG